MIFAVIKNGFVINKIIVDGNSNFVCEDVLIQNNESQIGDKYENGKFYRLTFDETTQQNLWVLI